MSLQPQEVAPVPETTARVARLAFRKGNVYMRMRDNWAVSTKMGCLRCSFHGGDNQRKRRGALRWSP